MTSAVFTTTLLGQAAATLSLDEPLPFDVADLWAQQVADLEWARVRSARSAQPKAARRTVLEVLARLVSVA